MDPSGYPAYGQDVPHTIAAKRLRPIGTRARAVVALGLVSISASACVLVTSFDGLSGGTSSAVADAAVPATDADGGVLPVTAPDASVTPTDAGSAYRAAVLDDGPVAYFGLEETSGTACTSAVANSAVTCLYPSSGATRAQAGVGGTTAVHFDASTATITLGGVPSDLAQAYTFEMWIRVDAVSPDTPLFSYETGVANTRNGMLLFLDDTSKPRSEIWSAGSLCSYGLSSTALTSAAWHHVVEAHEAGGASDGFYIDGVAQEAFQAMNVARPTTTIPLTISGFVGSVDEIAIYDKALDSGRVIAHYALH